MTSICLHDPPADVFTCGYFGCVQDTISHMAQAYDFQYELVQYKWPRWLHQQTEKQRIIWGYKILFLDVLFPLAVDKIIFVDADQVSLSRTPGFEQMCVWGEARSRHIASDRSLILITDESTGFVPYTVYIMWLPRQQHLVLRSAPYLSWVLSDAGSVHARVFYAVNVWRLRVQSVAFRVRDLFISMMPCVKFEGIFITTWAASLLSVLHRCSSFRLFVLIWRSWGI